jgi:hypothetical protein
MSLNICEKFFFIFKKKYLTALALIGPFFIQRFSIFICIIIDKNAETRLRVTGLKINFKY